MDLRNQYRKMALYREKSNEHMQKHVCDKCHVKSDPASSCQFFNKATLSLKSKQNYWFNETELNELSLKIVEVKLIKANCALISDNETARNG